MGDQQYVVVGPVIGRIGPVPGCYGEGPMEYGPVWVDVTAESRNAAIWGATDNSGVEEMIEEARWAGKHPFTYLRAIRKPPHEDECPGVDEGEMCLACARQEGRITRAIDTLNARYRAIPGVGGDTTDGG